MEISSTAYDDAFRTMINKCKMLLIPVVNECFGENFTGNENLFFEVNENFYDVDSVFTIKSDNVSQKFHIECEPNYNTDILASFFEHDIEIALFDGKTVDNVFIATLPKSAVIFLRSTKNSTNNHE